MKTRLFGAAAILALVAAAGTVQGDSPEFLGRETRVYDIWVDRSVAGKSTVTIEHFTDGRERATTDAKLSVAWVVFKYVYEFHGEEYWIRGQPLQLSSRAVDGGKRLSLVATQAERGWQISKGGAPPAVVADVQLTTNYWRQPAALAAGRVSVLDADNGKIYAVRCENRGVVPVSVGGGSIPCTHFQFKGDIEADLWFDAAGYLVRYTGTEEGHPTELRLVSRSQPALALTSPPQ
jgi:hypothetical protein